MPRARDRRPRVYLAGPEVFLPDAVEVGRRKLQMCEEHGLWGLYPLDNEAQDSALSIYGANRRFLDVADAAVANLTPFRGPSADVGTAFEVGYLAARGKPVFAYTNVRETYRERVEALLGASGGDPPRDAAGLSIEDFGFVDNLMLECAVRSTGGIIVQPGPEGDGDSALDDLATFRVCLGHAARFLETIG